MLLANSITFHLDFHIFMVKHLSVYDKWFDVAELSADSIEIFTKDWLPA